MTEEDMQYAFEDGAKWAKKEMADYKKVAVDAHRALCPELPVTKKMCYADALNIHKCNDECHYMKDFKELIEK